MLEVKVTKGRVKRELTKDEEVELFENGLKKLREGNIIPKGQLGKMNLKGI